MRYLSSISVALVVLMALACTATSAPTPNIEATVEARLAEYRTAEDRMENVPDEDVPAKEQVAKPTATPEPCLTDGEIFNMESKGEISQKEALAMIRKPRDKGGCPIQKSGDLTPIPKLLNHL